MVNSTYEVVVGVFCAFRCFGCVIIFPMQQFDTIKSQFEEELGKLNSLQDLENLRIKYLGKKGVLKKLLEGISQISKIERKEFGQNINALKKHIETSLKDYKLNFSKEKSFFDITIPGTRIKRGSLHMVTLAINEIIEIFKPLGFIRMSYPEVEWEYFAFDALNMPKDHPARDDFEQFFVKFQPNPEMGKMILSPHTSSGQIREMRRVKKPPIRMINVAKCYRPNWDTTHTPMFHQFEGLCIDKGINITNLKGTINYFVKSFFGPTRKIRLRPYHFQFTEPSFEFDISCNVCGGTGKIENNGHTEKCKVCKSGWLELGGAGMVHPNVLRAGGIDPELYSGWAFGIGIERIFMMKEGLSLDDIRVLYSSNIKFLKQF